MSAWADATTLLHGRRRARRRGAGVAGPVRRLPARPTPARPACPASPTAIAAARASRRWSRPATPSGHTARTVPSCRTGYSAPLPASTRSSALTGRRPAVATLSTARPVSTHMRAPAPAARRGMLERCHRCAAVSRPNTDARVGLVAGELMDLVLPAQLRVLRPARAGVVRRLPAGRPSRAVRRWPHGPAGLRRGGVRRRAADRAAGLQGTRRAPGWPPLAGYLAEAIDGAAGSRTGRRCWSRCRPARRAARQRGGDHLLRLARVAGRAGQLPVRRLLQLAGPVADSAGLSSRPAAANLAGRMRAARHRPRPRPPVLHRR